MKKHGRNKKREKVALVKVRMRSVITNNVYKTPQYV